MSLYDPIPQVGALHATLQRLRKAGVHLVGAADGAKCTLYEADLARHGKLGLVLGAEDEGGRVPFTPPPLFVLRG
jgi:tRNA G18 (ribose-2'-O)-methylase SpoU